MNNSAAGKTSFDDPVNANGKFLIYSTLLVFIYFLPLLSNNVFYIDDIGRVIRGHYGWAGNGRPFSEYIFRFLTGDYAVDIHPLPFILGTGAIFYAGWRIFKTFFSENYLMGIAGLMAIIINPFFLENFSYRFESMMMGFSASLAILSALILVKVSLLRIALASAMLFSMMCFYQASLGLFLIFSIALQYRLIIEKKHSDNLVHKFIPLLASLATVIISYIFYKIIYGDLVTANEYDRIHSQILSFSSDGAKIFVSNAERFFDLLLLPIKGHNGYFYILLIGLGVISSLISTARLLLLKKPIDALFIIFSPLLVILSSAITLCILAEPVFAPRVLIGVSGIIFFNIYIIYVALKTHIAIAISVLVFIASIAINYSYVNALQSQQEQERLIISQIADDLKAEPNVFEDIMIIGIEPFSDKGRIASNTFPVIQKLVPRVINNHWVWGYTLLRHHPETKHLRQFNDRSKFSVEESRLLSERSLYKLWVCKNILVLQFK